MYGDLIYYYLFLSISPKLLGVTPPGPSPGYGTDDTPLTLVLGLMLM